MTDMWVYAVPSDRYALIRGSVGRWLADRRIAAYRSNVNNGWWIRSERVPDLLAAADLSRVRVRLRQHGAPPHIPPTSGPDTEVAA